VLYKQGDRKLIWIGIGQEKGEKLWAEIVDENIVKRPKAKREDEWVLGSPDLNGIVNRETFEDQKIAVNEWYWEILEKLKIIRQQKAAHTRPVYAAPSGLGFREPFGLVRRPHVRGRAVYAAGREG
jgi:hypothetical protein